jgi:hypothetical protein
MHGSKVNVTLSIRWFSSKARKQPVANPVFFMFHYPAFDDWSVPTEKFFFRLSQSVSAATFNREKLKRRRLSFVFTARHYKTLEDR